MKLAAETEAEKKKPKEKLPPPVYQPYKCGLCEVAHESLAGIKEHCRFVEAVSFIFKHIEQTKRPKLI